MECIWEVLLGLGIWGPLSRESSSSTATTLAAVLHLPDDLLADVLGRLPARSLAASRCVCRSWRGVVDDRRLLLPLVLPHSVGALLLSCIYLKRSYVFARPTTPDTSRINSGVFTLFDRVHDQCNGLVLFDQHPTMYLCNPTTPRHGVYLHHDRSYHDCRGRRAFIAFDPAVSPHWEVLLPPLELEQTYNRKEMAMLQAMEWPPAMWTWCVCDSRTMVWQRRVFVRQGAAAGTAAELVLLRRYTYMDEWGWERRQPLWSCSAYYLGVLYLHCRGEYVCRLSLSTNKHQVFKSPIPHSTARHRRGVPSRIGTSKHGVYFAAIDDMAQLRVWILKEEASSGGTTTEWLLNHHSNVLHNIRDHMQIRYERPWSIMTYCYPETDERRDNRPTYFSLLGFHPYKEVIFLEFRSYTVAYHFNGPKVRYLGKLHPHYKNRGVYESFVYTPCLTRVPGMQVIG